MNFWRRSFTKSPNCLTSSGGKQQHNRVVYSWLSNTACRILYTSFSVPGCWCRKSRRVRSSTNVQPRCSNLQIIQSPIFPSPSVCSCHEGSGDKWSLPCETPLKRRYKVPKIYRIFTSHSFGIWGPGWVLSFRTIAKLFGTPKLSEIFPKSIQKHLKIDGTFKTILLPKLGPMWASFQRWFSLVPAIIFALQRTTPTSG